MSLVFGISATLAMNVAAGWHHGSAGALVAALPPVALVLSLETLIGLVRRSRERGTSPSDGQAGPSPGWPPSSAHSAHDAMNRALAQVLEALGYQPQPFGTGGAWIVTGHRPGWAEAGQ